jgi:hypothetical protein
MPRASGQEPSGTVGAAVAPPRPTLLATAVSGSELLAGRPVFFGTSLACFWCRNIGHRPQRSGVMGKANGIDTTGWFSAFSDGRLATVQVPLCDVIQSIWKNGQTKQVTGPAQTNPVPGRSTVKQG